MLLASVISFFLMELIQLLKGKLKCNEQNAHSRVHIISINSKMRFLGHKKSYMLPNNLVESGSCSPEVEFWQSRVQVEL